MRRGIRYEWSKYEYIWTDNNILHVGWFPSRRVDFERTLFIDSLLAHQGPFELGESLSSEDQETLERLLTCKALQTTHEPSVSADRYSRQVAYFKHAYPDAALDQHMLRNTSVTVLGLGGLGSNVACTLAGAGVGELRIADYDIVDESNLNRQVLYREPDVASMKVEVAARSLKQINSLCSVVTTSGYLGDCQSIEKVCTGTNFIVRAADTPINFPYLVNEVSLKLNIPTIGAGFIERFGVLGPVVIPGQTSCFACFNNENNEIDVHRSNFIGPAFGPVVSVVAGLISQEVILHLLGLTSSYFANCMLIYDPLSLGFYKVDRPIDPQCPICGNRRGENA